MNKNRKNLINFGVLLIFSLLFFSSIFSINAAIIPTNEGKSRSTSIIEQDETFDSEKVNYEEKPTESAYNRSEIEWQPIEKTLDFTTQSCETCINELTTASYNALTGEEILIPNEDPSNMELVLDSSIIEEYKGLLGENDNLLAENSPESVIPPDDRSRITPTTGYPWRTIVKLYITANDDTHWVGSGALLENFHVLTAGHCVYIHGHGGWVSSIEVVPAMDDLYDPYGHAWMTLMRSYTGWTVDQNDEHDWGVITLDRNFGLYLGYMGRMTAASSDEIYTDGINLAGYPTDLDSGRNMYWDYDAGDGATDYNHYYWADTAGGMSGGPVWRYDLPDRYILTIHTYGRGGTLSNYGTRLNQDKFDRIPTWISADTPPTDKPDITDRGSSYSGYNTGTVTPGVTSFNVWSDVRNVGTDSTGAFNVTYYASTDIIISAADYYIGNDTVSTITRFDYADSDWSGIFPTGIPDGNYYIGWIIDESNSVNEFNESNNVAYISTQITVRKFFWTMTEVVSTESTDHSWRPTIAEDGSGNVHLAWYDYTDYDGSGTDDDIFYKHWNATTAAWTTTEVVSTESTGDSRYPTIAADGSGNVHIAWRDHTNYDGSGTDDDIFYKRWNATTAAWTTTEVVSTESTGDSYGPTIAADGSGNVHLAWEDNTNYDGSGTDRDIFYKRWNATTAAWTTTEVVSTESTANSYQSSIAADGSGNVHIAWHDYTDYSGSGTDEDIFYKRWNATMAAWTTTEVVSTESTDHSYWPTIAADCSGNLHIAWHDHTDYDGSGTDVDIFYKRWNATTTAWTTTEVVSTESTDDSYGPTIAADCSGNLHIAWRDHTNYDGSGTDRDIFYKSWNATTVAWTTTEVVSTESTGNSAYSTIAAGSSGDVHIAWEDLTNYDGSGTDVDIFYKKLKFPSSPLNPSIIINNGDASTNSALVTLTLSVDGAEEMCFRNGTTGAWTSWEANSTTKQLYLEGSINNTEYSIYVKFRNEIGETSPIGDSIIYLIFSWTTTEVVSTESTSSSLKPTIAVDGSRNVHIAWQDTTNYGGAGLDSDIFYKRWNATTAVWTTTEVVSTESTEKSWYQTIAADGSGNVHIAWQDKTDYGGSGLDYDIFYRRWNATTAAWTTIEVVSTESTGDSAVPTISADDSGNVHIAWYDETNYGGSGTDYDIFYKRWNATTAVWTAAEVVSKESTDDSYYPTIAVDGSGNVHIAWRDKTDYGGSGTDYDIFYKRWNVTTAAWTMTEVVSTESTSSSSKPTIAVDGSGNVYLAWDEFTDYGGSGTDWDIFYKRLNASTAAWTTTEVVSTESTGDSAYPTIAADGSGNVHIAWYDETNYGGSGMDDDIFYKRWNATTAAWTKIEVVSTESTEDSWYPKMAVDGSGNVHITWQDKTNYGGAGTDRDIFYKKLMSSPLNPSIIINNGDESTNYALVTLTLSADGATEMCFRNGTTGAWTSWEPYATAKQLYLEGSINNMEYSIYVKFRNVIGEISPIGDSILYLVLTPPLNPSIIINNGDASTNSALVTLTLSADLAEEMCFRNGTTGAWTSWEPYATAKQLYLEGSIDNTEYSIYVKFRNAIGETSPIGDSILYLVLTSPLNPSIIINNGDASTNSALVTLTLSADGATEMCFRNGTTGAWTSWEAYSTTKQLYLEGSINNTEYSIYVKFRNAIGETSPIGDSILYLISIPLNPSIIINNGDASTNSTLVNLTLSADGATEMCFRNGTTGAWTSWEAYSTAKQLYLEGSINNMEYSIYVKFRNAIGETIPVSDDILFLITEDGDGDGNGNGVPEIPGYPAGWIIISLLAGIGVIAILNKSKRIKLRN